MGSRPGMNRRDFFKLGVALGAGAALSRRDAVAFREKTSLPVSPAFRTKHLVVIVLGNGARKIDVIDNEGVAPFQSAIARKGTLFTDDYGATVSLHGYMVNEVLTGRESFSQRPLHPTWNEYVRKKTSGRATEFWMLQGASYYGAWTWDVKQFSRHPDYGARFGATNLTINKVFDPTSTSSPKELVERSVGSDLGPTTRERRRLEEWLADARSRRAYELPTTKEAVGESELRIADCQALHLAGKILADWKPRILTVQILALDDAHSEWGFRSEATGYSEYLRHLRTTDELIGNLWKRIQSDSYLRETTSLLIRPECGRNDEVDRYGQLGHSPGDHGAHYVWTSAIGPDFHEGRVVTERVDRRDLAPTITYLMAGESAEHAIGRVRTQLFRNEGGMPRYRPPGPAGVASSRAVIH